MGHSSSAAYFGDKFMREGVADCEYRLFELPAITALPAMLAAHPDLRGFNVTIPYKQQVIPYLDSLSAEAEAIGAVNCVKIGPDGKLAGNNTDAYGFQKTLLELIGDARPDALVLGTGGASKAVQYVLRSLGISYELVSRTPAPDTLTYARAAGLVSTHKLIVNTTPLGMTPKTEDRPDLPYDRLTPDHFLYDLVYNPPLTRFLEPGQQMGAQTMNGRGMFVAQAERSWEIWNG